MSDERFERQVLFQGMVYNEQGEPAEVVYIGQVPHYAINDGGFKRHVEAHVVDSAVLAHMQEQISAMQDDVVRAILGLLGRTDIFTKAALDAAIRNLEQHVRQSDANQWAPMLRLLGFRVVVDVHGGIVEVVYPEGQPFDAGEDE